MTDPQPATRTGATGADLDARYGRTRPSRKPLLVGVIATLALVALAWLVWAALLQANPPVSSRLLGFTVTSPRSVEATLEVERTESVEASCRLQAKAADFSIVGELTVTVPADSPRRQTVEATLTTQRAATAVVLIGCTTAEAHRPN